MLRNDDEEIRTVFCGNLSEDVTDAILYELFNQAGPVESVRRPKDHNGRPKSFGFIRFKHECSVPYAIDLFKGTKLFNRNINLNTRFNHLYHVPVLDTHLTEFTAPDNRSELRRSRLPEGDDRNSRSRRGDFHHRLKEERDQDKASSWAELKNNPLQANRFVSTHLEHDGLHNPKGFQRENVSHPVLPDINALLQMGQQMIIPGIMGHQGIAGMPNIPLGMALGNGMLGLGPSLGNNIFPSMQGRMNGGERHSPARERGRRRIEDGERRGFEDRERKDYKDGGRRDFCDDRERRDYHEGRERRDHHRARESRRDHPYDNRQKSHREDHKHHDRGYSSSRSSHERESRYRRSR